MLHQLKIVGLHTQICILSILFHKCQNYYILVNDYVASKVLFIIIVPILLMRKLKPEKLIIIQLGVWGARIQIQVIWMSGRSGLFTRSWTAFQVSVIDLPHSCYRVFHHMHVPCTVYLPISLVMDRQIAIDFFHYFISSAGIDILLHVFSGTLAFTSVRILN